MFNRRRSRLEPSYTGVNHIANTSASPNSNALAAALTIGKAMKQQAPPPQQQQSSIRRSGSIQYITKPLETKPKPQKPHSPLKGSLKTKRNSLVAPQVPQSPRQPSGSGSFTSSNSRFSSLSSAPTSAQSRPVKDSQNYSNNNHLHSNRVVYDVEDGFDESYLDEITADTYLNHNHEKMKDLRLSHEVGPSGITRSGSRASLTQSSVKMVTKYIPTPSGIKTIQVPEASFKEEIARNNSLRSNTGRTSSLRNPKRTPSRSSSLNSLSSPARNQAQKATPPQKHRVTPLVSPKMAPMTENVELESSLAQKDELLEHQLKMDALDRQIQQEKEFAKELQLKKLEYERLVSERKKNEHRLEEFIGDETNEHQNYSGEQESHRNPTASSHHFDHSSENSVPFDSSVIEKDLHVLHNHNGEASEDEVNYNDDTITDKLNEAVSFNNPDVSNLSLLSLESRGHGLHSNNADILPDTSDYNLARHLRPTFDTVPEIIGESDQETPDVSVAPPSPEVAKVSENRFSRSVSSSESIPGPDAEHNTVPQINEPEQTAAPISLQIPNASSSSIHSGNSTEKKPVKSAMKTSTSFYNGNGKVASSNGPTAFPKTPSNPAHEVYLSLTTAENTRLNSKLSSTQLDQQPASSPARRKSQSLRPSQVPIVQQEHHQQHIERPVVRSLRPSSFSELSGKEPGMSGRSLRSSVYVQPIAPHPALQSNYVSPSKAKAAELYAKANSRPVSVFKPLGKQSSFTKENEEKKPGRQTMRDETPRYIPITPQNPQQPQDVQQQNQQPSRRQQVLQQKPHLQNPIQNGKTLRTNSAGSHQQQPQQQQQQYSQQQTSQQHPQQLNQQQQHQQPTPIQPSNGSSRFRSRFNDSDDEDAGLGGSRGGIGHFSSRFADSDDESSGSVQKHVSQPSFRATQDAPTLRVKEDNSPKPKKFGKLRKLFGKST